MTIEEKAKAYDEVLERVKPLYEWAKKDDSPMWSTYEYLFPQLAESEDERTRREIIDFIQWAEDRGMTRHDYHQAKRPAVWIAYLEKQKDASKAIEAVERIDKYIDEHLANAHDMKDSDPDKKYYCGLDDALGKMAGILQDVYSGEKKKESLRDFIEDFPYSDQKEQKSVENEDDRIRKALVWHLRAGEDFVSNGVTKEECLAYLEKQKEPENISASTMIPSFHEELTEFELVLFNAVLDNNFVGAKGSENALAMTKKVAPELLAIAKKEPDWDREKCFVCQEYEKGFKQGHLEGCTAGYNKAMKEVDDQKEQKPVEVKDPFSNANFVRGYESGYADAKREQKPAEWSANDKAIVNCIVCCLDGQFVPEAARKHSLEWFNKHRRDFLNQTEQEWSEEDRLHYANVLNALEYVKGCKSDYDKIEAVKSDIAWLRELPERFNLPPKQEWSEEDEEKLKAICTYLRDYSRLAKLDDKLRFNEYCDFLESLRPSWKPSEHQMTILKAVKEYVGRGSGYWGEALGSLIEDLEKLM